MRDSNEIMPALVFKYENAHIEFLITRTIELKLFRDYSKWPGQINTVPVRTVELGPLRPPTRETPRVDC